MASQAKIQSLMRDLEQSRAEAAEMQARLLRDCCEIAGRSLPLYANQTPSPSPSPIPNPNPGPNPIPNPNPNQERLFGFEAERRKLEAISPRSRLDLA